MTQTAEAPQWRGSLERLRSAGCPTLEPVLRGQMPHQAILVLDHSAINEVESATMEALTGAGYDNKLIVPELALDFFDKNAKTGSRLAFGMNASSSGGGGSAAASVSSPLRPKEFINYDKLQLKKDVLLRQDTFRVIVQRVDEYDQELLRTLNIGAQSFDMRLYVLCALYFKKKYKRPTVLITTEPVVVAMAAQYGILTCPAEDVCNCGSLIERDTTEKRVKTEPTPAGANPSPHNAKHVDPAPAKKTIPGAVQASQKHGGKGAKR